MEKKIVMLVMLDGSVIGEKIISYTNNYEDWSDDSKLLEEASYFFY